MGLHVEVVLRSTRDLSTDNMIRVGNDSYGKVEYETIVMHVWLYPRDIIYYWLNIMFSILAFNLHVQLIQKLDVHGGCA